MTKLEVSVDADFNVVGEVRVPASIWAVPPTTTSIRDITLPVGRKVSPAQFDVSNGLYVVDALLPSGRHVTAHIHVTDEGIVDLRLPATDEAEWQYLDRSIVEHSPTKTDTLGTSVRVVRQIPEVAIAVVGAVRRRLLRGNYTPTDDSDDIAITIARPRGDAMTCSYASVLAALDAKPLIVGAVEQLDLEQVDYKVLRDGRSSLDVDSADSGHGTMAVCEHGDDLVLCVVPTPWEHRDGTGVQVHVARDGDSFVVQLNTPDAGLDTALRFMDDSRIEAATTLLRERLLGTEHTFDAPYAFLFSCYQMIGALSEDFETVRTLIDAFCEVHPSIPDGAIVRAAYTMRNSARADGAAETARDSLLRAYGMGLPVFRQGLGWLGDGLATFDDKECSRAAKDVGTVAWSADNDLLFTCIYLNK